MRHEHSPNQHPIESRGSDSRRNQRPAAGAPDAPQIRTSDLNHPPTGRQPAVLPADTARGYTSLLERYRPVGDFNRQPKPAADPWVVTR